jgi:hypothetical protein
LEQQQRAEVAAASYDEFVRFAGAAAASSFFRNPTNLRGLLTAHVRVNLKDVYDMLRLSLTHSQVTALLKDHDRVLRILRMRVQGGVASFGARIQQGHAKFPDESALLTLALGMESKVFSLIDNNFDALTAERPTSWNTRLGSLSLEQQQRAEVAASAPDRAAPDRSKKPTMADYDHNHIDVNEYVSSAAAPDRAAPDRAAL